MEITPLGDSALIVRVRDSFEDAPDATLNAVLSLRRRLEDARLRGVLEITSAYTTVALFFDPICAIDAGARIEDVFGWLEQQIRHELSKPVKISVGKTKMVDVPVCYDLQFALDLQEVARRAKLEPHQVVDLHCGAEYRVHCVGFTPGFPFLGGLPQKLAMPRRSVPRKEVPAGSVAIGGNHTGIYPVNSPGGWNVIGRTPLRLFDPQKNPPALLWVGDRVRFRAITGAEFDRLSK
jgi:inhibitor of KinA